MLIVKRFVNFKYRRPYYIRILICRSYNFKYGKTKEMYYYENLIPRDMRHVTSSRTREKFGNKKIRLYVCRFFFLYEFSSTFLFLPSSAFPTIDRRRILLYTHSTVSCAPVSRLVSDSEDDPRGDSYVNK